MATNKDRWYPSAEFGFQAGHFLLGYGAVVTARKLSYCLIATALIIVYILIKEFIFTIVENDTIETGWKDLAFLAVGAIGGWGVIYLRMRFLF